MHKVVIRAIRFLPLLLIMLLAVQTGSAIEVLTFTDPFGPLVGNISTTGSLGQFNTGLGTLQYIVITLSAGITASGTVTNTSSSTGTVYSQSMYAMVDMASPSSVSNYVQPIFTAAPPKYTVTAGNSATKSGSAGPLTDTQTVSNSGDFAPYLGLGTFAYDVDVVAIHSLSTSGMNSGSTITTSGFAQVDYYYEPPGIPEPATLLLMGSALLGLGMIGRKYAGRRA